MFRNWYDTDDRLLQGRDGSLIHILVHARDVISPSPVEVCSHKHLARGSNGPQQCFLVGATRTAHVDTGLGAGLFAPSETPRGHAPSGASGDSKLRHLGRTAIVLPRAPDSIHSNAGCRFTSLPARCLPGSTCPAPMFRHHRGLILLRRSRLVIGPRRRRLAALRRDGLPAQLGGH